MSADPLASISAANVLSLRAVLVPAGQDPGAALAAAGVHNPVAVPCAIGEDPNVAATVLPAGPTPHLRAVLELGPRDDTAAADLIASPRSNLAPRAATTMLPPAFGQQPLAPVRRRLRKNGGRSNAPDIGE